jgi:GNAT superfamily N-acetyltransferase
LTIIPARTEHFVALRAIELAAFETLRMAGAVSGQPSATSLDDFARFSREGLLLAAFTPDAIPVGFVAGTFEDNWLHIAEIDVHPQWQRQGIGKMLMRALLSAGRLSGRIGATLTTDRVAAFNARFYASLGFHIVDSESRPPHLASHIASELANGFDPTRRVAMLKTFSVLK